MPKNILITGGLGFIGLAVIRRLLADTDVNIRVYDNHSVGTRAGLAAIAEVKDLDPNAPYAPWNTRLSLARADVKDGDRLASMASGAQVVIHLAASTGVAPSVTDPLMDCRENVLGTLNALDACRTEDIGRFVFASSGAPLGEQVPPLHENMAPRPASPYGASKLAGEGYCSAYWQAFGVETVALRFGNVYGPGSDNKSSVVAKFIKQALSGETLEIYGDGGQTRDFIYIDDIASAIIAAANVDNVGGEVFQIATSAETTVNEISAQLIRVLSDAGIETPDVIHADARCGDVKRNYSDTSKARQRLGWQAEMPLALGLRHTVDYFTAVQAKTEKEKV